MICSVGFTRSPSFLLNAILKIASNITLASSSVLQKTKSAIDLTYSGFVLAYLDLVNGANGTN